MDSSSESINQSSATAWSGFDGSASFGPSGYGGPSMMAMQPFAAPNMMPQSSMMAQQGQAEKHERNQHILGMKLGPEFLSARQGGGGVKMTYIEGWRAINIANEVFGYNGWSSETKSLEVDFIDQDTETGRFKMGVTAIVRVVLRDGTFREDVGYGKAEGLKSKGDGLEKCKKEAITDATKRTLRTFGNLLGNCLYDKNYLAEIGKMKAGKPKFSCGDLYRGGGMDNIDVPRKATSSSTSWEPSTSTRPAASSSSMAPQALVPSKRAAPEEEQPQQQHASRPPPQQRQPSALPPHMRPAQAKTHPPVSRGSPAPPSRNAASPTPELHLPDGDISEIDYSEGMDDAIFADVAADPGANAASTDAAFEPIVPRDGFGSEPQLQQQQRAPAAPRPQNKPVSRPPPPPMPAPKVQPTAPSAAPSLGAQANGNRSSMPPVPSTLSRSAGPPPQQHQQQQPTGSRAPSAQSNPPRPAARTPAPNVSRGPPTTRPGMPPQSASHRGLSGAAGQAKAALLDDYSAGVESPPDIETFGTDAGFGSARRLKRTDSTLQPEQQQQQQADEREALHAMTNQS